MYAIFGWNAIAFCSSISHHWKAVSTLVPSVWLVCTSCVSYVDNHLHLVWNRPPPQLRCIQKHVHVTVCSCLKIYLGILKGGRRGKSKEKKALKWANVVNRSVLLTVLSLYPSLLLFSFPFFALLLSLAPSLSLSQSSSASISPQLTKLHQLAMQQSPFPLAPSNQGFTGKALSPSTFTHTMCLYAQSLLSISVD